MATLPTSGWFTDPLEPRIERWWSGKAWTTMVRLRHDPSEVASSVPGPGMPSPKARHASTRMLVGPSIPLLASLGITAVVTTAAWWVLYEWIPVLGTAAGG